MDVGDLAIDEAAHENIFGVADRPRELEDLVTPRARPPAPANGSARDGFRQGRHRTGRRLESDTVFTHEGSRLARCHDVIPSRCSTDGRQAAATRDATTTRMGVDRPRG